jgi:CBS-domain-containing membrane protein
MLTARDIMTRDVITINCAASVRELSRLLSENRITGIPVVDDDKRLVGMISMRDLIREEMRTVGINSEYQDVYELFSSALNLEETEGVSARHVWVEEIMSKTLFTAVESTPVRELCAIMTKNNVHRVPILSGEKIVGLVTATDIIRALAEGTEV